MISSLALTPSRFKRSLCDFEAFARYIALWATQAMMEGLFAQALALFYKIIIEAVEHVYAFWKSHARLGFTHERFKHA